MEYLSTLHGELYPSPKARDLKLRIQALYKGFHTQERIRKNSYQQKQELVKGQPGYSWRKKRLHEQYVADKQDQLGAFEELAVVAEDADRYDSDADEESTRLEQALEREKASQGKQRKECRQAMEARDKRTIVSQREQSENFKSLVKHLNFTEGNSWRDRYRGCDKAQQLRTEERLKHYFVNYGGTWTGLMRSIPGGSRASISGL